MIEPLEPPASHHLSAAEGWLELGNPAEAAAELARLDPEWAAHPSVLELNWQINAHAGAWQTCLTLALQLVALHPELPTGYIHRSYALHELQRTAEARDLLLPAVEQFPDEEILPYNLACYECRLGNLPGARQWLGKIFRRKDALTWRRAAQSDPDLASLWPELAQG
jgi:tetratricopeptide (TPR) repeat protein